MLLGDLHGFTHSWDYWDHLGVEKKIWPSGNLWHFANGTMAQFEIVDVAVKMVILHMNHHFPMVFTWFSHGFPMVFPWFSHSLQRVLGMGLSEASNGSHGRWPLDQHSCYAPSGPVNVYTLRGKSERSTMFNW
jgi:hypothetical protein